MNPMQTAAPIASVRAAEGSRPEGSRLFSDPYARLFADAAPEVMAVFGAVPFFIEHIRLRTRFMDDAVRGALEAGIRDVVLVGAGFDCRALRMPEIAAGGARVIELDHEAQFAEKRRRLADAGVAIPSHVVQAPADLAVEGEMERALRDAGVPRLGRLLWICEGVFGYLTPDQLRALAGNTARLSGAGSQLVANYSIGSLRSEFVEGAFTATGWRVEGTPSFADLHRKHIGGDVPEGSDTFALVQATL